MKLQLKNPDSIPNGIQSLFKLFSSLDENPLWEYHGLRVEIDPTIDFKGNDALIRWNDIDEGFNDKLIVTSLNQFNTFFKLIHD